MNENEIHEIAEFISGVRENEPKSWWVGISDGTDTSPDLISTSLRGFFLKDFWRPLTDEHGGACCDALEAEIDAGKHDDDPFVWMSHCTADDHIRAMLTHRTDEQLANEYQYMLEQTLTALTENF